MYRRVNERAVDIVESMEELYFSDVYLLSEIWKALETVRSTNDKMRELERDLISMAIEKQVKEFDFES